MAGELNDNLGHDISVYAGDAAANLYIGIRRGMGAGGGYKEADSNIGQMMRDAGEPIGRRVEPAGRALGAVGEITAGAATSEALVGIPVMFHGADQLGTAIGDLITGNQHSSSLTSQGLQQLGMSKQTADNVDTVVSVAGTLGASSMAQTTNTMQQTEQLLSGQLEGRATQLADPSLISKLEERGYTMFQDSETQRLLDYFKANASTDLAGNISLRPDPRHVEVLEEYVHNVMNNKGMYEGLSTAEQEIMTKEWMIQHQRLLNITQEDATWLQQSANMYKK